MKRTGILVLSGLITVVFALGVVACSSSTNKSGTTPQSTTQATQSTSTQPTQSTSTTPAASATTSGTPQASGTVTGPISVTLNAMGGSGVTGTAVLSDSSAAGATQVVVTIDGGLTAGAHQKHIHTGQC